MAIKRAKKEMLHKAMQVIREKIKVLQFYMQKGELQMCRMTLIELLAYNELLSDMGIYSMEKKGLMNRIIKHYVPNPKHLLLNRLKGGIFP